MKDLGGDMAEKTGKGNNQLPMPKSKKAELVKNAPTEGAKKYGFGADKKGSK